MREPSSLLPTKFLCLVSLTDAWLPRFMQYPENTPASIELSATMAAKVRAHGSCYQHVPSSIDVMNPGLRWTCAYQGDWTFASGAACSLRLQSTVARSIGALCFACGLDARTKPKQVHRSLRNFICQHVTVVVVASHAEASTSPFCKPSSRICSEFIEF